MMKKKWSFFPEPKWSRKKRGYTLLELFLASIIFVVAGLALGMGLMGSQATLQDAHEVNLSNLAASSKIEEMKNSDFATLLVHYTTNGNPGPTFDVSDLIVQNGDPAGKVGTIAFITDETVSHPQLGLPRDLNGNGNSIDTDVSNDYQFLPTIITIRYQGMNGNREFKFYVLLAKK